MTDVHTEHCCARHGCKYSSEDCTVTTGKAAQSYPCEYCTSWNSGWPTKAGLYWFLGNLRPHDDSPRLEVVKAFELLGQMKFVLGTLFLDSSMPSTWLWLPLATPDMPYNLSADDLKHMRGAGAFLDNEHMRGHDWRMKDEDW